MFQFRVKIHVEGNGKYNYLVFHLMYIYFERVVRSDYIFEWKSKRFFDESIKSPSKPHNFLNSFLKYLDTKQEYDLVEVG